MDINHPCLSDRLVFIIESGAEFVKRGERDFSFFHLEKIKPPPDAEQQIFRRRNLLFLFQIADDKDQKKDDRDVDDQIQSRKKKLKKVERKDIRLYHGLRLPNLV